jgi:ATP-dependent Clp protease adaptor protein ClpS
MSTREDDDVLLAEPKIQLKTKKPPMFKVVMLNDDYTPMDFVVTILQAIFRMNLEEATQVMLNIHHTGKGICGVFTRDVAETKIEMVLDAAREAEFPLQCLLECE